MRNLLACEFAQLFRLRGLIMLGMIGASVLGTIGSPKEMVGFVIGLSLFVVKSFFLYETGRTLIKRDSKRIGRAIAGLSSVGRILFLAMALAFVFRMGQSALLAACGGLALGQIHLHLAHVRKEKTARCSNTYSNN